MLPHRPLHVRGVRHGRRGQVLQRAAPARPGDPRDVGLRAQVHVGQVDVHLLVDDAAGGAPAAGAGGEVQRHGRQIWRGFFSILNLLCSKIVLGPGRRLIWCFPLVHVMPHLELYGK